jgi:hypothetical protein
MTQFTCKGVKQINNRISFKHLYHSYLSAFFISAGVPSVAYLLTLPLFAEVSRVRALSPAWTGSHARETLISRTHLFLPHGLPPTKKSSTIKDHERAKLAVQLKTIDESFDLLHLLTRDSNKEKHQKKLTFLEEFRGADLCYSGICLVRCILFSSLSKLCLSVGLAFPTIGIRWRHKVVSLIRWRSIYSAILF